MQTTIHFNPDLPDKPIWTLTVNGKFTCASAYDLNRKKKPPNFTNRKIWHIKVPFKWSFCLWRAIRNKLSTDDRVQISAIQQPPGVFAAPCMPWKQ